VHVFALGFMSLEHRPLVVVLTGFTIGFAATALVEFLQPTVPERPAAIQEPVRVLAELEGVRIVGPPFVPNSNPRKR
jgi:hypothetical protein